MVGNRGIHPRRGDILTDVVQQQRNAHHRGSRVGDALARDVGGTAVHRFKHRRVGSGRVDIAAGGQADSAAHRSGEVGDDVAEKVVGDDDVEPAGIGDHIDGGRVDVLIGDLDVRILGTDLADHP